MAGDTEMNSDPQLATVDTGCLLFHHWPSVNWGPAINVDMVPYKGLLARLDRPVVNMYSYVYSTHSAVNKQKGDLKLSC